MASQETGQYRLLHKTSNIYMWLYQTAATFFMLIKPKENNDIVSPDSLIIDKWGLYSRFFDRDAITISFDGQTVFLTKENFIEKHPGIHKAIYNHNTADLRYWEDSNVIVFWIYDIDNLKMLRSMKKAMLDGNVKEVTKAGIKETCGLKIDIEKAEVVFCCRKDGGVNVVKAKIDELDETFNDMVSNEEKRLIHMSSPVLKYELISRDEDIRNMRNAYFEAKNRSWVRKHGNIDVAEYHLLMYEE